jgi:hypothetical protein
MILGVSVGFLTGPGVDSRVTRGLEILAYQASVVESHGKGECLGVSIELCIDLRGGLEKVPVVRGGEEWNATVISGHPRRGLLT